MRQTTTTDRPAKKSPIKPDQGDDREAIATGDDDLTDDELDELEDDEIEDEADEDKV